LYGLSHLFFVWALQLFRLRQNTPPSWAKGQIRQSDGPIFFKIFAKTFLYGLSHLFFVWALQLKKLFLYIDL
jgi:hypothetical protein